MLIPPGLARGSNEATSGYNKQPHRLTALPLTEILDLLFMVHLVLRIPDPPTPPPRSGMCTLTHFSDCCPFLCQSLPLLGEVNSHQLSC